MIGIVVANQSLTRTRIFHCHDFNVESINFHELCVGTLVNSLFSRNKTTFLPGDVFYKALFEHSFQYKQNKSHLNTHTHTTDIFVKAGIIFKMWHSMAMIRLHFIYIAS